VNQHLLHELPAQQGLSITESAQESCLTVVEAGRVILARFECPLDLEHVPQFLDRVQPLCDRSRRLVVDLRAAPYIDSEGVRALLGLQGCLDAEGGELRLVVQPDSKVERTLALLRLQGQFRTYESTETAWSQRPQAA
jgi:anti-anti-sigma factor